MIVPRQTGLWVIQMFREVILKIIHILLEIKRRRYGLIFTRDDNFADKMIWDIILINKNVTWAKRRIDFRF